MSKKIIIECPKCGRINEASIGFFSKRLIECSCGVEIDAKNARMITKECQKCGNLIVFDKGKTTDPLCPVCNSHFYSPQDEFKFVEVICPDCACHIVAKKNDKVVECPICKTSINVQARMVEQDYYNKAQPSLLKSDAPSDILAIRHPLSNFRMGSQIIVNESQVAVFIADGKCVGTYNSGRHTVKSDNLMLDKTNYSNQDVSFSSDLFFVSTAVHSNLKWGTDSKVRMFDPATGLHLELGAYGFFNYYISDTLKFLFETVGLNSISETGLSNSDFIIQFKQIITKVVKSDLAKEIRENAINILEIDEYIKEISDRMMATINKSIEKYGIQLQEFIISAVITPDDDPNFRRIKEQHAARYLKVQEERIGAQVADAKHDRIMAETKIETDVEILKAQAKAQADQIIAQGKANSYVAQAQAEATEMRLKGYSYQDETQRIVAEEAVSNQGYSIAGSGGTGGIGISEMASEAVRAGVIKEMGKSITKEVVDAMNPNLNKGWDCPVCHTRNISSNFCPNCGNKKPQPDTGWLCPVCGTTGITSNFCPNCGNKKQETQLTWVCPECGTTDISSNFCPNCGRKK